MKTRIQTVRVGERSKVHICSNSNKRKGLHCLKDDNIALTVTSPPYWNYIDYGQNGSGREKSYEHYLDTLQKTWALVFQKTMPGGRLVLNVSNMKSRKAENEKNAPAFLRPVAHDVAATVAQVGFTLFDEIVWVKAGANAGALGGRPLFGSYPYPPTPKILDSIFENIYVFTKNGKRPPSSKTIKTRSKLSLAAWREWTRGIWTIPAERCKDHPATFPMELAERAIRLYSFVGDTIIDPFAGSGTTIVAAEKFHRIGIGYEVEPNYVHSIRNRAFSWLNGSAPNGLNRESALGKDAPGREGFGAPAP